MEQLPSAGGMAPLNLLYWRSSTAKEDGDARQKEDGTCPLKLLLLALSTTRFDVSFHELDGKSPVNMLLETFSACSRP